MLTHICPSIALSATSALRRHFGRSAPKLIDQKLPFKFFGSLLTFPVGVNAVDRAPALLPRIM
jgi:hypothetical protein